MALVVESSGSQTATIGVEHSLATVATAKTRVLAVDMNNLVAGDTVELRIKSKARAADTRRECYLATFIGPLAQPLSFSIPVPMAAADGEFSLKQTTGTGRAFPWAVYTLD